MVYLIVFTVKQLISSSSFDNLVYESGRYAIKSYFPSKENPITIFTKFLSHTCFACKKTYDYTMIKYYFDHIKNCKFAPSSSSIGSLANCTKFLPMRPAKTSNVKITCAFCTAIFCTHHKLEQHMRTHNTVRTMYKCPKCEYISKKLSYVKSHLTYNHAKNCKTCGASHRNLKKLCDDQLELQRIHRANPEKLVTYRV